MKKLYFFLASLFAFTAAQAQIFTFNYNGEAVKDDKLVCDAEDAKFFETKTDGEFDIEITPAISISAELLEGVESGFDASLLVESLTGQELSCCAGGACSMGTKIEKTIVFDESNNFTVNAEVEYFGTATKESVNGMTAKLTVADSFEPEKYNKSLTVVMYSDNAGVAVIENNKHFQTARGGFSYDFPAAVVVTLYNAAGMVQARYQVEGNGFISTEGMPKGIYFFTAEGQGLNESGKVAI